MRFEFVDIDRSVIGALSDLKCIILRSPFERFLNQSSGGCIITGNCDPDVALINQLILLLNQSFTECPLSYHQSAVVILYGAAYNFTCRCGTTDDQNNDRHIFQ